VLLQLNEINELRLNKVLQILSLSNRLFIVYHSKLITATAPLLHQLAYFIVWYGIVEFNVPLDTV